MARPSTRAEFREYCLRRLGKPVIEINVSDEQIDDRIEDALQYYRDYHYDGVEKYYLKHQLSATDITNEYITVNENIVGVIRVFPIGAGLQTNNMFNMRYQIHLNDLYNFTSVDYAPYFCMMGHIQALEEYFVGQQPIRFNRHTDRLYIDMDWEMVDAGNYIVVECYRVVEPTTYADVWTDWWLQEYATELIKQQWGTNLKKYQDMRLLDNTQFSGQTIYDEATNRIEQLRQEMINTYSLPVYDMYG